jgi:hypothetical protein
VIDGVAVGKLDRFGRSLVDGLAAIERVGTAGGTFMSVQDGLDLSTDMGKLVAAVQLVAGEVFKAQIAGSPGEVIGWSQSLRAGSCRDADEARAVRSTYKSTSAHCPNGR